MRALLVATVLLLVACSAQSSAPVRHTWIEVHGLGHVVVAAPPAGPAPWLLGGGVIGPDGVNQVAIWSAAGPAGPWLRNSLAAVPGRDGPNETIQGFGTRAAPGPLAAVGSRPSPTEGYPRPSTWAAPAGSIGPPAWQEALAARELFGGPNVVAVGGMGAGPHGYFVAGTWIAPDNHVVAAVWRSSAGVRWTRDDTDPAFDAGAGTESYAVSVADGASGILVGGTTARPAPGDPTRQLPTLWHSADGTGWTRLAALPGSGGVRAVRALGIGWIAGGQAGTRPESWTVDANLRPSAEALPAPSGATVADLAVTPGAVLAAGLMPAGTLLLWRASRHGDKLGTWQTVTPPPTGTGWSGVSLAAAGNQVVLVVFNATRTRVWRSA
jgi:hypothetical protein